MTHLRELAQLFRRAIATVAFSQGAPESPTSTTTLLGFGTRLTLCVIAAATLVGGCTGASSRPADEPTVVDVVWRDGRPELADLEALSQSDGPVRVRFIKDDEVVKEYTAESMAQAQAQMEGEARNYWRILANRPGASPETKAFAELRESLPSDSAIMLMTDEERTRLLEAVKPLLAAGRRDMTAEEHASMLLDVKERMNAVASETAKR